MLKFKNNIKMLFIFALCFLFVFQAQAGKGSSDPCAPDRDGIVEVSEGGACTSIQSAIDLTDGTPVTINVSAGIYNESLTIVNSNIVLAGAGAESTKLINYPYTDVILISGASNVTVSGFTIEDSSANTAFVTAVHITDSTEITVDNNSFQDIPWWGVRVINSAADITSNKFGQTALVCAANVKTHDAVFVGNDTSPVGLVVNITGNIVNGHYNGSGTLVSGGFEYMGSVGGTAEISNNVIKYTDGAGIIILGYGEAYVRNNTIIRDTEQGIYLDQYAGSAAVISGNRVIDSYKGASLHTRGQSTLTFNNNVIIGSYATYGVYATNETGSPDIEMRDNIILNNAWDGLRLVADAIATGNTMTGNGDGITTFDFDPSPYGIVTANSNIYGNMDPAAVLEVGSDNNYDSECVAYE